jgi:hypothetical protein
VFGNGRQLYLVQVERSALRTIAGGSRPGHVFGFFLGVVPRTKIGAEAQYEFKFLVPRGFNPLRLGGVSNAVRVTRTVRAAAR